MNTNLNVNAPNDNEEFIAVAEVARRLRRSVRTVYKWKQRGFLPHYKVGRVVMFRWSDVTRTLNERFHFNAK
jgi:excisionase family DNA binding protein